MFVRVISGNVTVFPIHLLVAAHHIISADCHILISVFFTI